MARISNSAPEKVVQIKVFKGLHETKDSDTKIGLGEATQCHNFRITRDGNLKRREGNRVLLRLDDTISHPIIGLWCGWVKGVEYILAACNGKLYKVYDGYTGNYTDTVIGNISASSTHVHIFGFDEKAYILDGAGYYSWDGTTLVTVDGYVPLVANAIGPTGTAEAAGTLLEQVNKLTTGRRVWLSPDGTNDTFQLPEKPIVSLTVTDLATGNPLVYQTDYDYSPALGTVTFLPDHIPAKAANSIEVEYDVASDFRNEVIGMKYSELYSGASDNRVFLYGDGSNELLYSDIDYDGRPRADYFPDMNEVAVGDENTPVTGAIRHFSRLIIFKNNSTWSLSSSTLSLADGSLIPSFYVNPVNRAIGNDVPGQVQLVLNSPRNLYNNELYEWKGSSYSGNLTNDERQAKRISDRICNTLPTIPFSTAVCYDDNPNQCYYIVNSNTGNALVHNYAVDAWYTVDNLYATGFVSLNGVLHWGNIYGEIQRYDTTLMSDLWGIDEDIVPIEAYYESGNMDFGADYYRKYSSTMWVSIKPESHSYGQVAVVTDKKEKLSETDIKEIGVSNNAGFANWSFDSLAFDDKTLPHIVKLKMKAKKFVYYKLLFHNNEPETVATILGVDIRMRQTGYAK